MTTQPEIVGYLDERDLDVMPRDLAEHLQGEKNFPFKTPLIRLADYEKLQAECEKLRKDAETERAIQRAAEVLPPGYRIEIEIEKDAGSVALFVPNASVECDFQGGIAEQIADAIDAAMEEAQP